MKGLQVALCWLGASWTVSCGDSTVFRPPETSVVGQTLGTVLAISYAASLTKHALDRGTSDCYERILSNAVETPLDGLILSVRKDCGFPFPGEAEGEILVAGLNGGQIGFGIADFSRVRVDGRRLPITRASGYLAVATQRGSPEPDPELPPELAFIDPPGNPLLVTFADLDISLSPSATDVDRVRIDQWVGVVGRQETPDDFTDDSYWMGGQRASAALSPSEAGQAKQGLEVAQEFAAFSPRCRRNPQLGFVQLMRVDQTKPSSGFHLLGFGPECEGAGRVVLSLSEHLLSSGRRAPLDLLGPE